MSSNLHIHLGNSPEQLAHVLAQCLLDTAPADPMEPLRVGVGQRGMVRMVESTFAHHAQISTNVETYFPTGLMYRAAAVLDTADRGAFEPEKDITWTPELLQWAVFAELQAVNIVGPIRGDAYDPLRKWLQKAQGDADNPSRRMLMQLSLQLARVFDAYNLDRPEWHVAWVEEQYADQLQLFHEGGPEHLPEILAWQMPLWQAVHRRLAGRTPSPVTLLYKVLHARDEGKEMLRRALPALHLFGMEHIYPLQRELIQALSQTIPVHVYSPSPTTAWWQDVTLPRAESDASISELLVHFGQHTRFLHDEIVDMSERAVGAHLSQEYVIPKQDHVLGHLQRAILVPSEDTLAPAPYDADDHSLSFHVSHDALRQVEVLHDLILRCMERNPALEPSDFVVLSPQLSDFAPLIEAVFRTTEPRLAYRIEDRSVSSTNPIGLALEKLLRVTQERANAPDVLELLSQRVVQRRFHITDDDMPRIQQWMVGLDIRWGWNTEQRASDGRPGETPSTWESALQRLTLGVLAGADRDGLALEIHDMVAFTDLSSQDTVLVGKFSRYIRELFAAIDVLSQTHTIAEWGQWLVGDEHNLGIVSRLMVCQDGQGFHLDHILRVIQRMIEHATTAGILDMELDAEAFRTWLQEHLDADTKVTLTSHGAVSFARLTAARFASAKVVFLLGMDDKSFPRAGQLPSWDLRQVNHKARDHSDRDEDLYAMLQALTLAEEHFGILWCGTDMASSTVMPPAMPVYEFQRLVTRALNDDGAYVKARTIHHRMHPFSLETFMADPSAPLQHPFTYQSKWVNAAMAGAQSTGAQEMRAVSDGYRSKDGASPTDVSSFMLATALRNPQRTFLRDANKIQLEAREQELHRDDFIEANALDNILLMRAAYTALQRQFETTGTSTLSEASPNEMARLRTEVALRPGVLGEYMLKQLIAHRPQELMRELLLHQCRLERPQRYGFDDGGIHVHMSEATRWRVDERTTRGSDMVFSSSRYHNLIEPWLSLCLEAAATSRATGRIVTFLHPKGCRFYWTCTPELARDWLTQATLFYGTLWERQPGLSSLIVKSLMRESNNEHRLEACIKKATDALDEILACLDPSPTTESPLYRKVNENWSKNDDYGSGASAWEVATLGADRVWLPPFTPQADSLDRRMPYELANVYVPVLTAFSRATNVSPDAIGHADEAPTSHEHLNGTPYPIVPATLHAMQGEHS